MVPLKWGDALSLILPGAIAVIGLQAYVPPLKTWVEAIPTAGSALLVGGALLMAAAVAGGILEAFTRIGWERYCLVKLCPSPPGILEALNQNPALLDLYERGVQSSYKFVTAHANTAWALLTALMGRIDRGAPICSTTNALILSTVVLLLVASYVQWTYFVSYQKRVFLSRALILP